MQIDELAPVPVKEALDKKELSINQGYNLTRQLQEVPEEQREQAAVAAVELEKAKKEIRQKDAEIDQRSRVAGLFCRAFGKGCSAGAHRGECTDLGGMYPDEPGGGGGYREGGP